MVLATTRIGGASYRRCRALGGAMCGIGIELFVNAAADIAHTKAQRRRAILHSIRRRGPDAVAEKTVDENSSTAGGGGGAFELWLAGAVLSLRGRDATVQPLVDAAGNVLLWNGEIFGGAVAVPSFASDTQHLLAALAAAPCVASLMREICGPWAFVYWHAASRTLWHGRDALGRRSLLRASTAIANGDAGAASSSTCCVHVESLILRLSSVAPPPHGDFDDDALPSTWAELPADGIGSVRILDDGRGAEVRWHTRVMPLPPPLPLPTTLLLSSTEADDALFWEAAHRDGQANSVRLLCALSGAVRVRVTDVPTPPSPSPLPSTSDQPLPTPPSLPTSNARVAVLFSGGIDCMVLARLADLHLPPEQPLDLINVAFGAIAAEAPDRLTGLAGVAELRRLSPRTFHFIEVNVSLSELRECRSHLLRLLSPASTVMDLNIGAALWFGSRGIGKLRAAEEPTSRGEQNARVVRYANGGSAVPAQTTTASPAVRLRTRLTVEPTGVRLSTSVEDEDDDECSSTTRSVDYRSGARVLLLGGGADEQLAGYGRHQTVFRKEGWAGLHSELHAERERLWLRNLGRDDRVVSDWGREARHPYLDEKVMATLARTPLHHICDLRQPLGLGDKMILRRLARLIGLTSASYLQKRAIQFGTRIANKNVCGQAVLDDTVDLAEVVHPDAEKGLQDEGAATSRRGDAALGVNLSKKRGEWASARAAVATPAQT